MINIVRAKGGKQRRLPLDVITLAELRDYVAKRTVASDAPLPDIPAVGPETSEVVWNMIGKHVHPHSFRRIALRLQQVLGLASVSTTAVYLQFNDKDPARRM